MQCQSSHKFFEIIHKKNHILAKTAKFYVSNSNLSVLTPIFFRNGFDNFCFYNHSENSDSDQLHCYYMYVDGLSLLKRRLSHDVAQFLKWGINFHIFSPHILAWVYYFLVADLFSYPWFMPAGPQL